MADFCFMYIARCSDGSFYVGITSNLRARERKHNLGEGALCTKRRRPIKMIYIEKFESRKDAMKREKQLKGWTRKKKENLIKYGHPTKF